MQEQQNRTGNEFSAFESTWATHAFAGAAEHSRQYVEKSLRAFQDETAQLINRRIDHNNAAFSECQNSKDLADLVNAQHKWFADLNRDYYETWIRLSETTQRIIADGASRAAEQSETVAREVKTAVERRHAAE